MNSPDEYRLPEFANVKTIHILSGGEMISSVIDYMKVKHRFEWVDQAYVISEFVRLQRVTEANKKSLIVVYEDAQVVKQFVNVAEDFQPLPFAEAS